MASDTVPGSNPEPFWSYERAFDSSYTSRLVQKFIAPKRSKTSKPSGCYKFSIFAILLPPQNKNIWFEFSHALSHLHAVLRFWTYCGSKPKRNLNFGKTPLFFFTLFRSPGRLGVFRRQHNVAPCGREQGVKWDRVRVGSRSRACFVGLPAFSIGESLWSTIGEHDWMLNPILRRLDVLLIRGGWIWSIQTFPICS